MCHTIAGSAYKKGFILEPLLWPGGGSRLGREKRTLGNKTQVEMPWSRMKTCANSIVIDAMVKDDSMCKMSHQGAGGVDQEERGEPGDAWQVRRWVVRRQSRHRLHALVRRHQAAWPGAQPWECQRTCSCSLQVDFLGFALLIFLRPGFACSKTTMIKRLVLDSCSAILGSMLVHLTAF